MTRLMRPGLWAGICLISCAVCHAEVTLPKVFGDHMVLQRGKPIPVWGWAALDEKVTVTLNDETIALYPNSGGAWSVSFPEMAAGGPYTLTVEGQNKIALKDILIGDVWLCSGQSNMEWRLLHSKDGGAEVAAANHPQLRVLTVANRAAMEPRDDFEAEWTVCRPRAAIDYSAVAYYFGRELQRDLNVPIGLIHSSWGGSRAEPWISGTTNAAKDSKAFRALEDTWASDFSSHGEEIATYYDVMGDWLEDAYFAMNYGKSLPAYAEPPKTKQSVGVFPGAPRLTYNAMIAPLRQLPLSGIIWYQGESNASRAWEYRDLFPTLIQDWREALGQPDLPFLFVQLANFMKREDAPMESEWAELREAQSYALNLPNTGMAVIIDIGDADNIHPKNKEDVGKRLALAAMSIAYGSDIAFSGPVYVESKRKKNVLVLSFDHVGSGLMTRDNAPLTGFAIAGDDGTWVWAEAEIKGKRVRVWSDAIDKPVAARYGWANNPDCNLYNSDGLPASPFRTDDWPVSTQTKD